MQALFSLWDFGLVKKNNWGLGETFLFVVLVSSPWVSFHLMLHSGLGTSPSRTRQWHHHYSLFVAVSGCDLLSSAQTYVGDKHLHNIKVFFRWPKAHYCYSTLSHNSLLSVKPTVLSSVCLFSKVGFCLFTKQSGALVIWNKDWWKKKVLRCLSVFYKTKQNEKKTLQAKPKWKWNFS